MLPWFFLGMAMAELRQNYTVDSDDSFSLYNTTKTSTKYLRQLGSKCKQLRFSQKIKFDEDIEKKLSSDIQEAFPLGESDFPMSQELCVLLAESNCHSVVMPNDYQVKYNVAGLVNLAGGQPPHAPDADFWPIFEEVVDHQARRRRRGNAAAMSEGGMPWLNLPTLWENFTVNQVAEAVHNEYPGLEQQKLISVLIAQGITPDTNIFPRRCKKDFLRGIVMSAHLNTWAIDTVGAANFAVKYFVGRARPEEVAWSVRCSIDGNDSKSECADVPVFDLYSIPTSIKQKVRRMKLQSMESFTAYPEGSPMHPSFPAMHSAASSLSMWLPVVANLTPEQVEEVKKLDFAVAMARTVAGVHYRDDNIAGLIIGQEIIARELPGYLRTKYGANAAKVREKISQYRFDWRETAERFLSEPVVVS